uniref:Uncharacterized protein n=1 Tax=Klebsiella pneumoniae TaxID=573 RepID=A0A8B0SNL0_KLEPN|nr:hypothetical protein [Klebsiella pneumoniae]
MITQPFTAIKLYILLLAGNLKMACTPLQRKMLCVQVQRRIS